MRFQGFNLTLPESSKLNPDVILCAGERRRRRDPRQCQGAERRGAGGGPHQPRPRPHRHLRQHRPPAAAQVQEN